MARLDPGNFTSQDSICLRGSCADSSSPQISAMLIDMLQGIMAVSPKLPQNISEEYQNPGSQFPCQNIKVEKSELDINNIKITQLHKYGKNNNCRFHVNISTYQKSTQKKLNNHKLLKIIYKEKTRKN